MSIYLVVVVLNSGTPRQACSAIGREHQATPVPQGPNDPLSSYPSSMSFLKVCLVDFKLLDENRNSFLLCFRWLCSVIGSTTNILTFFPIFFSFQPSSCPFLLKSVLAFYSCFSPPFLVIQFQYSPLLPNQK